MGAADDRAYLRRQDAQERRHDARCPNCGKYVEADGCGYYDKAWPYSDEGDVLMFCDENCADEKRAKDAEHFASRPVPRGTRKA